MITMSHSKTQEVDHEPRKGDLRMSRPGGAPGNLPVSRWASPGLMADKLISSC